jgi:tripartite-type tricarboxylate transporter receptor subunit TctC
MNCAVGGRNSLAHLTGELLRARSGAKLSFVYYPGASQALNDVIAGRVPILVNVLPGIAGAIASNQVKLLSITSPQRLRSFPDVPATAEAVPGFTVSGWTALVGPRGTPAAVVKKVNGDLLAVQANAAFKAQLETLGVYTRPLSPPQVAEFIHGEQQLWRPLVRELGVKPK